MSKLTGEEIEDFFENEFRCDNCMHFDPYPTKTLGNMFKQPYQSGYCLLNPPKVTDDDRTIMGVYNEMDVDLRFPIVFTGDRCSHFITYDDFIINYYKKHRK